MEVRYFANNASTTLVSDGGATITVASTVLFPSSYPFYITLENTALIKEIIKVTSLASAGVWNVLRAQEGTVQTTFAAGSKVEQRLTAGTLNSLMTDKADLSGALFTGAVRIRNISTNGSVRLSSGNSVNSGFIEYFQPSGVRSGYMGYIDDNYMYIVSENSRNIQFDVNNRAGVFSLTYSGTGLPKAFIDGKDVPRRYTTGTGLPTSDIGPIWHDDYNQWMTWQTFNANGATYTGYASVNVGQLIPDGQASQRTGRLRSGGSYSKTTYAAIWNWALHNNLVVALGSWAQGMWAFADNGDGTFRTPDIRGEFFRIYDDGRGVDTERTNFRNWQGWQYSQHDHYMVANAFSGGTDPLPPNPYVGYYNPGNDNNYKPYLAGVSLNPDRGNTSLSGGTSNSLETRSRNFAQYGSIQF